MVLTRSQKTSLKTSENDSKSDGDTDHDCSSCSAEKTVSKKPKAKRPFSESPTPLAPSESNVSPQPDSTTPPLASTTEEGKRLHASTEAPEKDKDAVAVATDDEVGENEPVKGNRKRRRKRNRKRKMTTDNENRTDMTETENSTQNKETVEPSISSSTPSVEGLKELNTSVTAEKEAANGKKLKLAENTSVVDDHDDSHSELQKENVNTTAQELGAEQKLEPEGEKSEAKIPTVNAKEVVQLYKKESYTEGQAAKPKGKPKSGRHWKTEQTARFSGIKQDRPLKTSWQRKMQEKAEMKNMKTFEAELKEAKSIELERKKKQRAKKIKRKLENQRKSEVVQVISNPAKIKRMKKKQLRNIEMRSMPDSSKKQVFK